jgi:serine/threonine protein phosphatase PrpC
VNSAIPEPILNIKVRGLPPTHKSVKTTGLVKAFAANTHSGPCRSYNEDRISIFTNIKQPKDKECEVWPLVQFYGIYDGHSGHMCADFLRDNLHLFIVNSTYFPSDPCRAIDDGCAKAEKFFTETIER